jgi:hypothetical protein
MNSPLDSILHGDCTNRSSAQVSPGFSRVFRVSGGACRPRPSRTGREARPARFPHLSPPRGCQDGCAALRVGDPPPARPVLDGLLPAHCRSG